MRSKRPRTNERTAAHVPATAAAKNFGGLLERVRETRETYLIERGGRPVAQIGPYEERHFTLGDFKRLLRDEAPGIGEEYLEVVERAVAAHNRPRRRPNPWGR